MRCGCRNNGLKCSAACGDCQDTGCQNTTMVMLSASDEDSDLSDDDVSLID